MATVTTSSGTITVQGELTIGNAAELKGQLLQAMDDCGCALLDLSAVNDMDTAGFQLLSMLKGRAEATGTPFGITAHSPASRGLINLLMASGEFGITTTKKNRGV